MHDYELPNFGVIFFLIEKIFKLEEIYSKDLWTLEFGITTIENANQKMQSYEKVLKLCNLQKTKLGENQYSI